MLSKTSIVSAAFMAVLGVSASPINAIRDAATSIVLLPAPAPSTNANFKVEIAETGVSNTASFFWTNAEEGILANLTLTPASGARMLDNQDLIQSVACSNSSITLKFHDASSFRSAKSSWSWINQEANTAVYVIDGGPCGGQHGRQPYVIKSISYNDKARSATMKSKAAKWQDFAEHATLRITGVEDPSELDKRAQVSKKITLRTAHDFSGTKIYSTNYKGVNLAVTCADCQTTGSLLADLTLSTSNGFTASLTSQNTFSVRFAVGVSASGSFGPFSSPKVRFASIHLDTFSISGLVEIGPQINFDAQAYIQSLTAQVQAQFGAALTLPDGSEVAIGKSAPALQPQFSRIGPSWSSSASATAQVIPVVTLNLAGTFFGKGIVGGVALQAPVLTAIVKANGGSNGATCGNTKGVASVSFGLTAGVEFDVFGGWGTAEQLPNKKTLFTKAAQVFDQCVAIER